MNNSLNSHSTHPAATAAWCSVAPSQHPTPAAAMVPVESTKSSLERPSLVFSIQEHSPLTATTRQPSSPDQNLHLVPQSMLPPLKTPFNDGGGQRTVFSSDTAFALEEGSLPEMSAGPVPSSSFVKMVGSVTSCLCCLCCCDCASGQNHQQQRPSLSSLSANPRRGVSIRVCIMVAFVLVAGVTGLGVCLNAAMSMTHTVDEMETITENQLQGSKRLSTQVFSKLQVTVHDFLNDTIEDAVQLSERSLNVSEAQVSVIGQRELALELRAIQLKLESDLRTVRAIADTTRKSHRRFGWNISNVEDLLLLGRQVIATLPDQPSYMTHVQLVDGLSGQELSIFVNGSSTSYAQVRDVGQNRSSPYCINATTVEIVYPGSKCFAGSLEALCNVPSEDPRTSPEFALARSRNFPFLWTGPHRDSSGTGTFLNLFSTFGNESSDFAGLANYKISYQVIQSALASSASLSKPDSRIYLVNGMGSLLGSSFADDLTFSSDNVVQSSEPLLRVSAQTLLSQHQSWTNISALGGAFVTFSSSRTTETFCGYAKPFRLDNLDWVLVAVAPTASFLSGFSEARGFLYHLSTEHTKTWDAAFDAVAKNLEDMNKNKDKEIEKIYSLMGNSKIADKHTNKKIKISSSIREWEESFDDIRDEAHAETGRSTLISICITIAVVGGAVLLAFLFSWALISPLASLSQAVTQIAFLELDSLDLSSNQSFLKEIAEMQVCLAQTVNLLQEIRPFIPATLLAALQASGITPVSSSHGHHLPTEKNNNNPGNPLTNIHLHDPTNPNPLFETAPQPTSDVSGPCMTSLLWPERVPRKKLSNSNKFD